MDPRWFPRQDRPLGNPGRLFGPFAATCFVSMLPPQSRARTFVALPVLIYCIIQVPKSTSGTVAGDITTAINFAMLSVKWIDFVLVRTPETYMHRVKMGGESKGAREPEDPRTMALWQKVKWNLSFWINLRGVGWDWQVKNVDPVPQELSKA